MEHLAALGLTPETVLVQLERAAHGRWHYLKQCKENGIKLQPSDAVDHLLMNHMMLLDSLATLGGVENTQRQQAVARGKASGSWL